MREKEYVLFNVDVSNDGKVSRIFAIKVSSDDLQFSPSPCFDMGGEDGRVASKFEEWVGNPYNCKFISFETEELERLIDFLRKSDMKFRTKDFPKVINYQCWNVKNELSFRMGLSDSLSLDELLGVYGISFVGSANSARDRCFNTYALVSHFKFDLKRNRDIFVRPTGKESGKASYGARRDTVESNKPQSFGEKLMVEKMRQGWHILVECDSKCRGYGLKFTGEAFLPGTTGEGSCLQKRRAEGKSLDDLMKSLFAKDVV